MVLMSSTDLEILNLKRQVEIQNSILEAMLEELRIRNKKTDEIIELEKETLKDKIKKDMEDQVLILEKVLLELKKDFEFFRDEDGISDTRREWLDICVKSMDTEIGKFKNVVRGV